MDIHEERYKLEQLLQANNWRAWAMMVDKYHALSQQLYGVSARGRTKTGWSMRDTAESLKRSVASIQLDLTLARYLKNGENFEGCESRENAVQHLRALLIRDGINKDVGDSQKQES